LGGQVYVKGIFHLIILQKLWEHYTSNVLKQVVTLNESAKKLNNLSITLFCSLKLENIIKDQISLKNICS